MPSSVVSASIPNIGGGPTYSKVNLTVYTTTLTEKTDIEIELYRTECNGTNFYKVLQGTAGSYSTRIFNSKTVASIAFVDDLHDSILITNELLYTTGGVLENTPAAESSYAVSYKNRVVLLSTDGTKLYYSKLREQNGPVEFSDSLYIVLDAHGGPATSMAVLDDHIIIFKKQAIFALTGEGPNNLGEQDDFRQPYLISSDAGCTHPNSIVRTPDGIMFKSDKGIYQIKRNFTVTYIGAPVETYNGADITSATLLEATNEVRFTTDQNIALVYDYFHDRWCTFTNIDAVDAVEFNGIYSFVESNGQILQETPGLYSDSGSYIKSKITTAWVSMAAVQGFQRFYELQILGTYKASHKLRVKMAYDFVDAYIHDVIINAATTLNPSVYGVSTTYGSETPYGGVGLPYQFRIFPKIQKCQSFKVSIEDFKTDVVGEGYSISNFAILVGIKAGLTTHAAAQTFGPS